MAYTITLTSSDDEINSDGDTFQVVFTFDVDAAGSNESYTFADKNIVIMKYGSLDWSYEMDDPLMIPGTVNMQISDVDQYIDDLLFGDDYVDLDKQFKVELKLNSATEFIGNAIEETIFSDDSERTIDVQFSPRLDIINKKMIINDDDRALDPFDYTTQTVRNISNATHSAGVVTVTHASGTEFDVGSTVKIEGVVGMTDLNNAWRVASEISDTQFTIALRTDQTYTSGGTCVRVTFASYRSLYNILEDIFQLVDSTITLDGGGLDLRHDWMFYPSGYGSFKVISNAVHSAGVVTITTDTAHGFSVNDWAFFYAVVGMTDLNNRYFEVQSVPTSTTFTINLTTAQTYTSGGSTAEFTFDELQRILVYDWTLFNNVDYRLVGDLLRKLAIDLFSYTGMIHSQKAFFIKLFYFDPNNTQTLGTVLKWRKNYRYSLIDYVKVVVDNVGTYLQGTFTELADRQITRDDTLIYCYDFGGSSGTNIRWDDAPTYTFQDQILDVFIDASAAKDSGDLMAQLWYNYRGDIQNCRVDEFILAGIDYNFLKNFTYNSKRYQIIGMTKKYDLNETRILAINLGADIT